MDHAEKLLRKVRPKHRAQILRTLNCIKDPLCRETLRLEKLKGSSVLFNIHVGRYRVVVYINESDIHMADVRLRNEKTYRDI